MVDGPPVVVLVGVLHAIGIYVCAELVNGSVVALVGWEDGVDEIDRVERFGQEQVSSVLSSSFSLL